MKLLNITNMFRCPLYKCSCVVLLFYVKCMSVPTFHRKDSVMTRNQIEQSGLCLAEENQFWSISLPFAVHFMMIASGFIRSKSRFLP